MRFARAAVGRWLVPVGVEFDFGERVLRVAEKANIRGRERPKQLDERK
jgi:hypothetical protein